jgi:hypothetical protein
MVYRGHVQNGVVQFDEAVDLPDGTLVEVRTASSATGVIPSHATEAEWKEALARIAALDIDWDAYRAYREIDVNHARNDQP